jgi:uncharacterized membrane protein
MIIMTFCSIFTISSSNKENLTRVGFDCMTISVRVARIKSLATLHFIACFYINEIQAPVRAQVSTCWIFDGQSGTGIGLSPSPSVFPCQYHSTAATYSLMYHLRNEQWTS